MDSLDRAQLDEIAAHLDEIAARPSAQAIRECADALRRMTSKVEQKLEAAKVLTNRTAQRLGVG